ncbi:hypothetical protein E4T44_11207 [Aureobasidium sp. EXF-8845]|nr:hypothetical protein E4T45_11115 [Aureobasidium sp. EXF-8846]KAI4807088.1 hypothetical protein E4T44_11207 [Aureobasidium sp. EXF-8845]
MPPAISEDEDERSDLLSDDDQLPPKKPATKKSAIKPKPEPVNQDPEDDQVKHEADDDDDDDDDEDNADDSGAMDVLKAYWDKIGGKPQPKPKTPAKKGTKRKSLAQHTPEPDASSTTKKRARKSIKTADEPGDTKTPTLPEGSWEDHVELVEAVEKSDHGELMFFLKWQDGSKTQHSAQLCRQKCPQKVIYTYPQPPIIC